MFKYLQEDEIEQIAREVGGARQRAAPTSGEQVLEEFHNMWHAAEYVARGGVDYAQKLLREVARSRDGQARCSTGW